MRTGLDDDVVRLADDVSLLSAALRRDAHLRGGDAPALRAVETRGEEFVDQPCHGSAEPPTFMVQRTNDDPVDAGRIVGSPWHDGDACENGQG